MKRHVAVLVLVSALPVSAAWNYDYNPLPGMPNLGSLDNHTFTQNGTVVFGSPGNGPNAMIGTGTSNFTGGSLIETNSPYSTSEYEIRSVLRIQNSGGNFVQYIRSQPNSLNTSVPSGPFFTVELNNPQFTPSGCMATLSFFESDGKNASAKGSSQVPCNDHMEIRTVVFNVGSSTYVWTMINGLVYAALCDIAAGNPGIGLWDTPAVNGIERVEIGSRNLTPPAVIDRNTIGTSSFPDRVDMHWTDPPDVTNVGVFIHGIARDGVEKDSGFNENDYTDDVNVQANQTYQYQIVSTSFHGITSSPVTFSVTTPAAGSIDPRRVGLKPTGSSWGALGENIDNLSGNLNFTVPLLQAKSRGGWGVTFSLSYNSQMWRKDSGGTWLMGQDVGYGMGWRLMAGSVTPAFNDVTFTVDHWTYTDSSGAEYRLNVNNGNVWSSTESIYVTFDANTDRLWFQNGSFWYMGSVSGGEEQDAGTRYPTLMQDKNGNQIQVSYDGGAGLNYYNSSARITAITDIRATGTNPTYALRYDVIARADSQSDIIPHLTAIRSNVQTGESYFFYRASGVNISSPWGDSYGSTDILQQVVGAANPDNTNDTTAPNRNYHFFYDPAAEMTQAALPPGGYLRWDYLPAAYSSNRTEMEVVNRYLAQDAPAQGARPEAVYHITHEGATGRGTVHNTTNLVDPTNAAKVWTFTDSSSSIWQVGLLSSFKKQQTLGGATLESNTVTWAQTPTSNNPYVSVLQTQTDNQPSKTTQALDQYGNTKEQDIWSYPGSNPQPDRIYRYNYAHDADGSYANYYIRSALVSKTVLDGSGNNPQVLTSIGYDQMLTCHNGAAVPNLSSAVLLDHANRTTYLANVTTAGSAGAGSTCYQRDVAGDVYATDGPGKPKQEVSYDSSSNYSVPSTMTLNQDQNSLTSFSYTPWLAVSTFSGPNGATGSYMYDNYAQPTRVSLTTGGQVFFVQYPGGNSPQYFPGSSNGFPWAQVSYIDGHYTRKTLDGLGRVVKEERGPTGANSLGAPTSVVNTVYGPCACSPVGKMVRQSQPYKPGDPVYWTTYTYDGMGRTLTVTGPDGQSQTKITYNAQASGVPVAPPTNGSSVTTVDPKGNWKMVISDIFGNVSQVTEPNPATANQPLQTYYTYDKVNHLLGVSMPRNGFNQTRTFTYDSGNFALLSEIHPETGTTTYQYHADSHGLPRLWIKTDAKNQQTKIEDADYDAYNRPLRVKFLKPVSGGWAEDPCQQVNYSYDTYPANSGSYLGGGWGRKTTSQVGPSDNTAACAVNVAADGSRINQNFLQAFGYTSGGQVQTKRLIFNQIQTANNNSMFPPTQTTWDTSYTYDSEGYQTSVTYPMGQTHVTALDFMKRPYSLTYQRPGAQVQGSIIQSVAYNAADQVTQMVWAANNASGTDPDAYSYSSITETRAYNSFNQVTQIQAQVGGAATVDLNYTYTPGQNNGQVATVASGVDANFNVAYTYDSLKRLTQIAPGSGNANTNFSQSYTYDGWGNMSSKTGGGSNFTTMIDANTNRPYGGGICYDQNGNLQSVINQCSAEYLYDIGNRLVRVASSSNGQTDQTGHLDQSAEVYYYTADNKRVTTVRPTGNTMQVFYVYGAKGEIAAICTSQLIGGTPSCDVREPRDLKFAGRVIRQNFLPVTVDRLGSVVANPVNGYGSSPTKYYLPYGEQLNYTQSPATFPGTANFATYLHEESTGLNYADQRFYHSGLGRFMQADRYRASAGPEDPGSWNRYPYVTDDPANYRDPLGLYAETPEIDIDEELEFYYGAGGGSGPPPKRFMDTKTVSLARALLSKRLKDFNGSNCQRLFRKILPGWDTGKFLGEINSTGFIQARGGGFDQTTVDQLVNNGDNTPIGQLDGVPQGITDARTVYGKSGAAIVLFPNFFGNLPNNPTDESFRSNILFHELLHVFSSTYTDIFLQQKFGLDVGGSSQNITDFLARDCTQPK